MLNRAVEMLRIEIIRRVSLSSKPLAEEDLLKLVFGLREIEVQAFRALSEARHSLDIGSIAEKIERDRTTAQRSLCNLVSAGLVIRQIKPHRRLYYTYEAVSEEEIRRAVREYVRRLNESLERTIERSF